MKWSNITVKQFLDLLENEKSDKDYLNKLVCAISIVTKKSIDELKNMKQSEFKLYKNLHDELMSTEIKTDYVREFAFNNKKLELSIYNYDNISLARHMRVQDLLTDEKNLLTILVHIYDLDGQEITDSKTFEEVYNFFAKQSIEKLYGAYLFFCLCGLDFIKTSQDYSILDLTQTMSEAMRQQLMQTKN